MTLIRLGIGIGPVKNPYSVREIEDCQSAERPTDVSYGILTRYSDKILANLLAIKADLCGQKFEVKIDNVLFVGYPMLLHPTSHTQPSPKRESPTMISFSVLFALPANIDASETSCYCDMAKQLAIALRHEERRCGYLNQSKNLMWAIQDEVAALPEDSGESPYKNMLHKCDLARLLRDVYDELQKSGVVQLRVNSWVQISFCLPSKHHSITFPDTDLKVKREVINECLKALRPYHGMLFMVDADTLLESLPLDASPCLQRLIRIASPVKNLQMLAADTALSLTQVYHMVSHLFYWGKATIIYPLCETNVYVLASNTNIFLNSSLQEKFTEQFPGMPLAAVMADFSMPCPLGDHRDVLSLPQQQTQEIQTVIWLLQHRLLVQLHTYVFYMTPESTPRAKSSFNTLLPTIPGESFLQKSSSSVSDIASLNSDESINTAKSPSLDFASDAGAAAAADGETFTNGQVLNSLLSTTNSYPGISHSTVATPETATTEDRKLFARLLPYFDGNHHLEEIMYYENIRRSQLLALLDKYRSVLVTCQHEQPGISAWATMVDR